jgi:L-threonylcarbamoyladenylate synthase
MIRTRILPAWQDDAIREAVSLLQQGKLVAFPTDTVYGLAAGAFNAPAIERLFATKGRETTRAIAILIGDFDQLGSITSGLTATAERLVKRFWPGPLTVVLPRHPDLPDLLSPQPTIGVRMPDHPVALALLQLAGPLAVTSANLSGQANTTTAQEVLQQLGGLIPLILDGGRSPGGEPSTVVDCTGPELNILRPGPILPADLLA